MSIAFVFPGQGSHRGGVLATWADHPAVAVVDEVADAIGRDVRGLLDDPGTALRTADAQPAILTASLISLRALEDAGIRPLVVAGHSLGEVTAAVAAGVFDVADAARLVAVRGQAMAEACEAVPGTMAALLGCDLAVVEAIVAADDEVVIANDNAPGQVVIAGSIAGIDRASEAARAHGARLRRLEVEGAFHSPAMALAFEPLKRQVDVTPRRPARLPLVTGTTARVLQDPGRIATAIVEGVLAPVRWRGVQQRFAQLGVTDVVEVGPGGVLAGLARRSGLDLRVHRVADPGDLEATVERLGTVMAGAR